LQRTCNVAHGSTPPGAVNTAMVLPRVEVLSVGQAAQSTAAGGTGVLASDPASSSVSQGAELVTLAVQQADAERLIEIGEAGLPYLALLTPTSQTRFDPAPVLLIRP
jgi:pilus assembly protein CpaB